MAEGWIEDAVNFWDGSFRDVPADAWYSDSVNFVQENGWMSGTSPTVFSPSAAMERSMAATVLWRLAGSPQVDRRTAFSDVPGGVWYAEAVDWAASQRLISGYGNGRFGPNDPVTREQLATILWRYEGSPWADAGTDFADESDISPWASTAVDWARAGGIINGRGGNRFSPKDSASRAETAMGLMNYLQTRRPCRARRRIYVPQRWTGRGICGPGT